MKRKFKITLLKLADILGLRYYLVRLDTNNLCNLKCVMCSYKDQPADRKRKLMSLDLYKKIAQEIFPKTRYLYLSCGFEPLLTPRFDQYLKIAKQYFKIPFVSFCTNATLLNEKIAQDCVKHQIDEVVISFDAREREREL